MSDIFDLGSISYVSDPVPGYVKALTSADTPGKLREVIRFYSPLMPEVQKQVDSMADDELERVILGIRKEPSGEFYDDDVCMDIILPPVLVVVTEIANQFHATWGTAYHQMLHAGMLEERDGAIYAKKRRV